MRFRSRAPAWPSSAKVRRLEQLALLYARGEGKRSFLPQARGDGAGNGLGDGDTAHWSPPLGKEKPMSPTPSTPPLRFSLFSSLLLRNADACFEPYQRFAAPSTTPTMLYRFEKNVNQSSSTFCSLSGKSAHSGETSSAFVLVFPRARDASWPANTVPQ